MPDTENPTTSAPRALTFTSNFPIPLPMNIKGDPVNNWKFFRQQWTDYEVATGLDKQEQKICLWTLKIVQLLAMNAKHARNQTTLCQYADQLLDHKLNK